MTTDYTFPDAIKDPAADKKVRLSLFRYCATFWRRNTQFDVGAYARPTRPTGFAYQSSGGTSGQREPTWPRALGLTVTDGSITWTCVAAGANGLSAVSSPTAVSDPTGITITEVAVEAVTDLIARYSGGVLGQNHDAVFSFTLNGLPRVARQRVKIRKR